LVQDLGFATGRHAFAPADLSVAECRISAEGKPVPSDQECAMATIRKETKIHASPQRVWEALRDVGALHTRLAVGFVVDTRMEGNARVVTFGNGMVAREDIVSVDEPERRVVWAIVGQQFHHFNGAAQVFDDDGGTRFVWTTDMLPDELAGNVDAMMGAGITAIKTTIEHAP
jgi:carbon monoxide dehydrogenase subunit G